MNMLTMQQLYIDLDDVLVPTKAAMMEAFGFCEYYGTPECHERWLKVWNHPSFFADLPLSEGASAFIQYAKRFRPIILTSCGAGPGYENVAMQKKKWSEKHFENDAWCIPMLHGRMKYLFMYAPGDILIDDSEPNIERWIAAGGVGILHRDFKSSEAALRRHLEDKEFLYTDLD